jgi:transcriptional regulator with XRE-family HTH domain
MKGAPNVDDWHALAEALTARMRERGMTQRELAERSGVSVATIRQIQAAKTTPRARTLADLSRSLGWSENHLERIVRPTSAASQDSGESVSDSRRIDAIATQLQDLTERVNALESTKNSG